MQDMLWCCVVQLYNDLRWTVGIPKHLPVYVLLDLVEERFPSDLPCKYVYEARTKTLLNSAATFEENGVETGMVLFLL